MAYESAKSKVFLQAVASWITQAGEVLAMIRFHAAAGNKSFEFFHSFQEFESRIVELPPQTSITVFRERQLTLRGTIDERIVKEALNTIPDGEEWLFVRLTKTVAGSQYWFHDCAGTSHSELEKELREEHGNEVAIGLYPPWFQDSESVISVVQPNMDGTVSTGVY